MDEKKIQNGVAEEANENVDTLTTEENMEGIELTDTTSKEEENPKEEKEVKTYTEEEVQKMLSDKDSTIERRLARQKTKLEKDYKKELSKYKETENILNAGLGTNNIDDANKKMADYYENEGIKIPKMPNPGLSVREEQILAEAEANDIIESGDIEEELESLLQKDIKSMTTREKSIFKILYETKQETEANKELTSKGIDTSILKEEDFKKFRKNFAKDTNLSFIVDLYSKQNPGETKKPTKIGSMESNEPVKAKKYYTPEEARQLSRKDLDDPSVMSALEQSMKKW